MAHGFPLAPPKPWKERIRYVHVHLFGTLRNPDIMARILPCSHFTWAWHAVIMGTGITSALITNFPYGGGSDAVRWVGFGVFVLNFILFVFVCGCTVARYIMFPEVCIRYVGPVPRLSSFILGLGAYVEPPSSKLIHWMFPNGCDNVDQCRSGETLHVFLYAP